MMLSFLIISAIKADSGCTVSDDLVVTGNLNVNGRGSFLDNLTMNSKNITDVNDLEALKIKASQYCDENGIHCHDASDGWGSLDCFTVINTVTGSGDSECGSDRVMTGGGCNGNSIIVNMPMEAGGNGWHCASSDSSTVISVRARCCKIN